MKAETKGDLKGRLSAFRQLLAREEAEAALISNPVNCRYLSGFDGSSGLLLIGPDQAYLITDFRYIEQAEDQAPQFTVRRWKDDLYASLMPLIEKAGWSRIGFESRHLVYSSYLDLKAKLGSDPVPLADLVENMRMIKSGTELLLLREGASLLDRAFEHVCSLLTPGSREIELALDLEIFLRRNGATAPAFPFIVASGARGALPHGVASEKIIQRGELVTIDFGAVYGGYATDMTRTVALGKISRHQEEIYDIVYEAQQAGISAVRAGVKCSEVDAAARKVIREAGCSRYFGHGLGHGVGLDTHELPALNARSNQVLEKDMVITIEPGIYIPGQLGMRIEDMVRVDEHGPELLTASPRQPLVL